MLLILLEKQAIPLLAEDWLEESLEPCEWWAELLAEIAAPAR
jgi:hypothetical protein